MKPFILLLIALFLTSQAEAAKKCVGFLTEEQFLQTTITKDKKLSQFLIKARKEVQKNSRDPRTEEPFVVIRGKTYFIGPYLGRGSEGQVYLGMGQNEQLVTLKIFRNKQMATIHISRMKFLNENGIRALKTYGMGDLGTDVVVAQEYIEGISLMHALENPKVLNFNSKQMEVLKIKKEKLYDKFYGMFDQSDIVFFNYNIFYEFSTGELVVIDGH